MKFDSKDLYGDVIGLTGVIGSGKSTVADTLLSYGVPVIKADDLARIAISPEYINYNSILSLLKSKIEIPSGISFIFNNKIDRSRLSSIIFNDENFRNQLNSIIHPEVQKLFLITKKRISKEQKQIVYDIPLLFEGQLQSSFKKIVVVYCDEQVAIERAATRMNISREEVKKRLLCQISIEEKKKAADYLIDNNGSIGDLNRNIQLFIKWLKQQE